MQEGRFVLDSSKQKTEALGLRNRLHPWTMLGCKTGCYGRNAASKFPTERCLKMKRKASHIPWICRFCLLYFLSWDKKDHELTSSFGESFPNSITANSIISTHSPQRWFTRWTRVKIHLRYQSVCSPNMKISSCHGYNAFGVTSNIHIDRDRIESFFIYIILQISIWQ